MWTRRHFLEATCTSAVATALLGDARLTVAEAPAPSAHKKVDLSPVQAAQGVLNRQLGAAAAPFQLSFKPSTDSHESYEIESSGGIVHITGSSAVALCRGAYSYLREQCGAMLT